MKNDDGDDDDDEEEDDGRRCNSNDGNNEIAALIVPTQQQALGVPCIRTWKQRAIKKYINIPFKSVLSLSLVLARSLAVCVRYLMHTGTLSNINPHFAIARYNIAWSLVS